MFCKKGIYVNWGNIPHLEFDFGPINLFSGGNGSGKTTAADGLQSLMTAAHENLFTYNPGQDETTQKGRGGKQVRTLASYVLGCDDGSYARVRPTDGYVAGVFHPTAGETGDVFTAVMCVRARLDTASSPRQARQDELLFLIIPNEELSLKDFVVEDSAGKYVVPINEVAARLRKKIKHATVETYDKKGPYLRRLYGALKGLKGAVADREAKHAARTFSNFMAYKPVKSITEFVAREILEPKDLSEDIRQVSELMKTIHSMDEETRNIREAIGNLEQAKTLSEKYVEAWVERCVGEYSEASRRLVVKQQEYLRCKGDQRENAEALDDTQLRLEQNDKKKQGLHEQLIDLQAQRQGIDALKDKDKLEGDVEARKKELIALVGPLLTQDQQFEKNYQAIEQLQATLKEISVAVDVPSLDSKPFRQALKDVLAQGESTGLDTQQLLTKDWVGISALEHKLEKVNAFENIHMNAYQCLHSADREVGQRSLRDQIFTLLNKRQEQLQKAQQQLSSKQAEMQQLKNHRVSYPHHVETAVEAIRAACPEAKPCVLCDYIEVTDEQWQMAIEGYIGGARFSIIVEPDYEAEAIRIVRSLKTGRAGSSRNNARVIQGAKAQRDATKTSVPSGSIFEVMNFEHKIVEYYIKTSYGTVVRVNDEQTLRKTAKGITAQGLGSGNYSMFRCDIDDAQLVFGQGARERALAAQAQHWEDLQKQVHRLEEDYHQLGRVHELVGQVKAVECGDLIQQMLDVYRGLQRAENQLDSIDLSDFKEFESRIAELRSEYQMLEKEGNGLRESLGALNGKTAQLERLVSKLADEQDTLQEFQEFGEQAVCDISDIYTDFNSETALKEAEEKARLAKADFNFEQDNQELLTRMDRQERQLYELVLQHNQMNNSYNGIVYFSSAGERNDLEFFTNVVKIGEQVTVVYNSLKNNVLVGKHEKLSTLKESFNTAFVTNLCHSIYQSINQGKRILEELNKELEHHRFGADRERFYFAFEWVPEFREYWRFFKEVIDIPNLGDGATLFDADLSDKARSVRDKLLGMLLDKDEQTALRELKRISDYRHYRQYEIFKEPMGKDPIALSTYGTGSGGQLETPAYIIRSAAVTSAFHFNEGNSHCRMVLVDEAFSKMDETRSREVISYLTNTLGLQLIFIMPTSKSGPFMDLISNQVIFSKCPTVDAVGELNTRVWVDRKNCNQEKIKALWAKHRKTIRQQAMLDFMEDIDV